MILQLLAQEERPEGAAVFVGATAGIRDAVTSGVVAERALRFVRAAAAAAVVVVVVLVLVVVVAVAVVLLVVVLLLLLLLTVLLMVLVLTLSSI